MVFALRPVLEIVICGGFAPCERFVHFVDFALDGTGIEAMAPRISEPEREDNATLFFMLYGILWIPQKPSFISHFLHK
jgi:hypothetical protein